MGPITRALFRRWAGAAVVMSLLAMVIAAPAASAQGTQTETIWIPLYCNLGSVTVNVGAAFTATVPTSVTPGEDFNLQDAVATIDIAAGATNAAAFAFGNPSEVEGAVSTFDTNLTNATAPTLVNADTSRTTDSPPIVGDPVVGNVSATPGVWSDPPPDGGASSDPNIGDPTGSPAVVNLVAAAQPPNTDAPTPLDPLINGGSPLAAFPDYPEPPLEGVFSWGPAPVDGPGADGTMGGNPTTNAYAPAPGTGGGGTPTSGTPDPANTGPILVTGAPAESVKLGIGDPSDLVKIGKSSFELAVNNDIFFLETTGALAGSWSADTPTHCGIDTTAGAVPSPNPNYLSVSQGIQIPILSAEGPTITTQPVSQSVTTPATATFSVSATASAGSLSYQWASEAPGATSFSPISGATSSSYSTPPTTAAQSGTKYEVVVSDANGSVTSSPATLTVNPVAAGTQTETIWTPLACSLGAVNWHIGTSFTTTVPSSLSPGQQFSLQNTSITLDLPPAAQNAAAFAFGNPDQVEGAVSDLELNVTGATAPTLVDADTTRTNGGAGTWAEATVVGGGVSADPDVGSPTGSPAQVNLVAAAQPPNTDAPSPLDPVINGPSPLAGFPDYPEPALEGVFSWGPTSFDGSGQDGTVGGDPATDAYAPVPGTGGGATLGSGTPDPVTVGPFTATAGTGPVVLKLGEPSAIDRVGTLALEHVLTNDLFFAETTGDLAGQWSSDTPVSCGIDTSSGAVPPQGPQPLSDSSGISIPVESSSPSPPTITTQPVNQTVNPPATATFSVTAAGTAPLSYQWLSEAPGASSFTAISGATSSSYTTPATTASGSGTKYEVTVSNSAGSVTSNAATLTSIPASVLTIVLQPASQTVTAPATATFVVGVTAGPTPTYQWYSEEPGATSLSPISGATSSVYTTPATTVAQNGTKYEVVVQNTQGSMTSAVATLTVTAVSNGPSVTSVLPRAGGPFSLVLIFGKNLTGASAVTFGGHKAIDVPLNGGLILALAPLGPSGAVDVRVTTKTGTSPTSSADRFTYTRR